MYSKPLPPSLVHHVSLCRFDELFPNTAVCWLHNSSGSTVTTTVFHNTCIIYSEVQEFITHSIIHPPLLQGQFTPLSPVFHYS